MDFSPYINLYQSREYIYNRQDQQIDRESILISDYCPSEGNLNSCSLTYKGITEAVTVLETNCQETLRIYKKPNEYLPELLYYSMKYHSKAYDTHQKPYSKDKPPSRACINPSSPKTRGVSPIKAFKPSDITKSYTLYLKAPQLTLYQGLPSFPFRQRLILLRDFIDFAICVTLQGVYIDVPDLEFFLDLESTACSAYVRVNKFQSGEFSERKVSTINIKPRTYDDKEPVGRNRQNYSLLKVLIHKILKTDGRWNSKPAMNRLVQNIKDFTELLRDNKLKDHELFEYVRQIDLCDQIDPIEGLSVVLNKVLIDNQLNALDFSRLKETEKRCKSSSSSKKEYNRTNAKTRTISVTNPNYRDSRNNSKSSQKTLSFNDTAYDPANSNILIEFDCNDNNSIAESQSLQNNCHKTKFERNPNSRYPLSLSNIQFGTRSQDCPGSNNPSNPNGKAEEANEKSMNDSDKKSTKSLTKSVRSKKVEKETEAELYMNQPNRPIVDKNLLEVLPLYEKEINQIISQSDEGISVHPQKFMMRNFPESFTIEKYYKNVLLLRKRRASESLNGLVAQKVGFFLDRGSIGFSSTEKFKQKWKNRDLTDSECMRLNIVNYFISQCDEFWPHEYKISEEFLLEFLHRNGYDIAKTLEKVKNKERDFVDLYKCKG